MRLHTIHYRTDVHSAVSLRATNHLSVRAGEAGCGFAEQRRERWSTMDQDQAPRTETSERPRGDTAACGLQGRRRALDRLCAAALGGQASAPS